MSVPAEPTVVAASARRFASNIRWQFVANGSQALLGGAYLIALGRILGPSDFGVFSAVTALVSVVGLLLEMRLQEVVARDFCQLDDGSAATGPDRRLLVDLFALELLSRLIPALGLVVLSGLLARAINLPVSSSGLLVLAAAGFVLAKSGNSVATGMLRVLGRTDLIAGCMAADWGLRLLLTVALAIAYRMDISLALWVALFAGGAMNILQVRLAVREYGRRFGAIGLAGWTARDAWARLRHARRLIAANLGISGSDLMTKDLDVALISGVLSPDRVGLYKMAKSFVQVLWRAIDPFYIAIMPEVQKLWQQAQTQALVQLLRRTSARLFALSVALVLVAFGAVHVFGEHVLGAGYAGVGPLMLLMSGWVVISAPLIWGIPLAVAVNRPELSVLGSVAGLVVGLAAFATLTPLFGLNGAALAWNATLVVTFAVTTGLAVRTARRHPDRRK